MYVSHLSLNDYRSYKSLVVELPPSAVVLVGANGRGKTNLVEALSYLSTFSSHRVSSSAPLVRRAPDGEDQPGGAVVRARVREGGRSTLLELEIARGRANRARLNKANVAPRELLGHLRTVVFAPEDLELLRGDPSSRRRFLDEIITKLKPHFLGVRQDFERVQKQRAAALKQMGRSGPAPSPEADAVLDVWDRQLAQLSAVIVVHRRAVVDALRPLVAAAYGQVTEGDRTAEIAYVSHVGRPAPENPEGLIVQGGRFAGEAQEEIAALADDYVAALRELRAQELRRGANLEGAHRDDLLITLDHLPVKGYASHGELWSSALMLRLAELELLRLDGDYPVLVLDDVFAELDTSRRLGLLRQIADVEQVLVTVAVDADVPAELAAQRFRVDRDEEGFSRAVRVENANTGSPVQAAHGERVLPERAGSPESGSPVPASAAASDLVGPTADVDQTAGFSVPGTVADESGLGNGTGRAGVPGNSATRSTGAGHAGDGPVAGTGDAAVGEPGIASHTSTVSHSGRDVLTDPSAEGGGTHGR